MSLLEAFSKLSDPRRAQGKRFTLPQVLALVFLSYLCGYHSYRKIMKFGQSCEELLGKELGLMQGIPSYVTIREVLESLDESSCIDSFNTWAGSYVGELAEGEAVSLDGKSLSSTLQAYQEHSQDFKAIVSVFAQKTGLIYQIATYRNKKISEIEIVRQLLGSLQNKGLLLCADALHCQKKQYLRL